MARAEPSDGAPPVWRAVRRHTAVIAAAVLAGKMLGFVEKQAIAYYFGTGPVAEAYFVMTGLLLAIATLARELTEPVLLPLLVTNLCGPDPRATPWRTARPFLLGVVCAAGAIALLAAIRPTAVIAVVAPGLTDEARRIAAELIMMAAAGLVFLAGSAVTHVALNGAERFGRAAAADLVYRTVLVAACCFAAGRGSAAFALGCGAAAAALCKLALQVRWLVGRAGPSIRRRLHGGTAARRAGASLWPVALVLILGQLADLAETHVTSRMGPGALSARLYARKIVDLPVLLAPYVLSVAVFPALSRLMAANDRDGVKRLLEPALRLLLAAFVPLAIVTSVFAEPLVALLLQRGKFDAAASDATGGVLAVYALGLPAFALEALLIPVFFAANDTRTPAIAGACGIALHVAGLFILGGVWGTPGIAGALVLAKTVKVVIVTVLLHRRGVHLASGLLGTIGRAAAAALPACWVALALRGGLAAPAPGPLARALPLAWAGALTFAVFAVIYLVPFLAHPAPRRKAMDNGR